MLLGFVPLTLDFEQLTFESMRSEKRRHLCLASQLSSNASCDQKNLWQYMYICIYVYMYMYVCIYIYIYIHIHIFLEA